MEALFEKWKSKELHKGQRFIPDGIVSPVKWHKAPHKVLFILKEAYAKRDEEPAFDLRNAIKNQKAKTKSLKPLGQWAYGLHNILSHDSLASFVREGSPINEALFASAVINIKKSNGTKTSKNKNLALYVGEDKELIKEQIFLINPDIVVCGRTWPLIKDIFTSTTWISRRVTEVDGIPFVNFWHPANRAADDMKYYSLCALVQQYLQTRREFELPRAC